MTTEEFIDSWADNPRDCRHKPLSGTATTLRSYGEAIAEEWPAGARKFLVAEYGASQTTKRHINLLKRSVRNWIEVPDIRAAGAESVMAELERRHTELQEKHGTCRYYSQRNCLLREMQEMKERGRKTARFFQVPEPQWIT